jgi:hypothetical protein
MLPEEVAPEKGQEKEMDGADDAIRRHCVNITPEPEEKTASNISSSVKGMCLQNGLKV